MFRRQRPTEAQVHDILKTVPYPGYSRDIVSFGMVKNISIDGRNVGILIRLTEHQPEIAGQIRESVSAALRNLPAVANLQVDLEMPPAPSPQVEHEHHGQGDHGHDHHNHGHDHGHPHGRQAPPFPTQEAQALPGVRSIVAVASGKGGVGKSTVATNLAVALGQAGLQTGLLDADIYGPNIPLLMGVDGKPEVRNDNRIVPFFNHGVKMQSLGFFLTDSTPVIWRGPMVMKAVQQLLQETDWGELDVLVIDLPPGTGDVQLTLVQTVPLTGAVLVTTPQNLALLDVQKGAEMFKHVNAPLLGIVENMSFYQCPDCGKETEIFRRGGGQKESERLGIPLLGRIPLESAVCDAGDAGVPVVVGEPDGRAGQEFRQVAAAVVDVLTNKPQRPATRIIN
ncbi:MAG: Mrp/NBP35 family ATP-binding protein [Candidatus Tectomicrobia bacterium]|nr:Mrp/NBP35 family ATP-binding protein [Candidatus Tectomicrobia bacterium]